MPAVTGIEKVTEEQATEAIKELVKGSESEATPPVVEETPPVEEAKPTEEAAPVETEQAATEETQEPEAAPDDLQSLQKRIEQAEADRTEDQKRFEARVQAIQQRSVQNQKILNDRYLRKSTAANEALQALNASLTEEGVSKEDVVRVVERLKGTMNPQSPSYVAPEPSVAGAEDQTLVINTFLDEKGLTESEAGEFSKWLKGDAETVLTQAEQMVAGRDLDGFLRIAHTQWEAGKNEKNKETRRNDAVESTRVVQRTQRQAARAASSGPTSPKKQPASTQTQTSAEQLMGLPKKERDAAVSSLLRQTVLDNH